MRSTSQLPSPVSAMGNTTDVSSSRPCPLCQFRHTASSSVSIVKSFEAETGPQPASQWKLSHPRARSYVRYAHGGSGASTQVCAHRKGGAPFQDREPVLPDLLYVWMSWSPAVSSTLR